MAKYILYTTESFNRSYKKFRNEKYLLGRIDDVMERIVTNPFNNSFKTHLVNIPSLGKVYSSRISGDLRLIWTFDSDNKLVIIALRVGGHGTVYK